MGVAISRLVVMLKLRSKISKEWRLEHLQRQKCPVPLSCCVRDVLVSPLERNLWDGREKGESLCTGTSQLGRKQFFF